MNILGQQALINPKDKKVNKLEYKKPKNSD